MFILFQYYFSIGFKLFVNRFHNLTMVFIIFSIGFDMFSLVSFSQFLGTISKGVLNSAALLGWDDFVTIFCSIFPILDFPGKWSSRMNNLSRKVHTFVDQVSQNVFHHFTIGFLSNFPTYCSFLPLILSNSPTYFSTGSQQYFPMYFMMFSIDFHLFS